MKFEGDYAAEKFFPRLAAAAALKCSVLFRTLYSFLLPLNISNHWQTVHQETNFLERKDEKMLKKLNLGILCFILTVTLSLSGCGGKSDDNKSKNTASRSSNSQEENEDSEENDDSGDSEAEGLPSRSRNSHQSGGESWVFYWYLCGSDLESRNGCASDDLEELTSVQLPENVTVVFEAGGASAWSNGFNPEVLTRGVYNSDGLQIIEEIPSANMGDPATLTDFLSFCNSNYPADRRAIFFWNHGGGSVSGAAFDELYNNDSIQIPELIQALNATNTGEKYELIGFDTCLMATIDVANACDEFANYLVASEELEPGCGWSYDGFMSALAENPSMDGAELGKHICDSFYEGCAQIGQEDSTTLSVTDLSKVPALVKAYDVVGSEALLRAGGSEDCSYVNEFARCAKSAENYGGNNDSEGYTNMVDLGDLVRLNMQQELLPETGQTLLDALDEAVVYKINGPLRSQSTGLSCYYSYNADYQNVSSFANLKTSPAFGYYFDYIFGGKPGQEIFDYAIDTFTGSSDQEQQPSEQPSEKPTEQPAEQPSEKPVPPITELKPLPAVKSEDLEDFPVEVTEDNSAVLKLGKEIADQLTGVYFKLAYIDEKDNMAVFLGEDNDLDSDWQTGIFKDNFRGVWGSIDDCLVYMELSDETEDYQIYAVPILLNSEEYVLSVSYDYKSKDYKILGARKAIGENGMGDKFLRELKAGDVIEPIHYVLPDLKNSDDVQELPIEKLTVTADTKFKETELGDGRYLFMFEMKDVRNKSYDSQAVMFSVENGQIEIE